MTMVIDFVDGFTSSSDPYLVGLGNEVYPLLNSQLSPVDIVGLQFSGYTSIFATIEVERFNSTLFYRQTIHVMIRFDSNTNTFNMTFGNYDGDDLIQDAIALPEHVVLAIDAAGQISYMSGNMDSFGHELNLKVNLTRINA